MMRRRLGGLRSIPPLLLIVSMILSSMAAMMSPRANGDEPFAPLDELMETFVKEHRAVGAALGVARGKQVIYAKGFGFADAEQKQAVTGDSLFRVASVSKPITAAGIMLLVREGKLSLDDKVVDALDIEPSDKRWTQVTIRHLLWHAGGWDRDKSFDPMFKSVEFASALDRPAPATAQDVIDYMSTQPLDFDPGQRYAYSNFGYCLLGRVIEAKSGLSYETYTRRRVLRPMGIKSMRIGRTLAQGRAKGEVKYYVDQGQAEGTSVFPPVGDAVPAPYGAWHLEAMDSHGAWIGSARDVCRFGAMLSHLLRPDELQAILARPPAPLWSDPKQQDYYYGFGWLVRPAPSPDGKAGPELLANTWHTGSLPGTSTLLVRRWDGMSWVVLFNRRKSEVNDKHMARIIDPLVHDAVDKIK